MEKPPRYWFPAKTYGWGWGVPSTWQGWVVLIGFIVLVAAAGIVFPPPLAPLAFAASLVVLCLLLIGICYAKGEPPGWRWGDE